MTTGETTSSTKGEIDAEATDDKVVNAENLENNDSSQNSDEVSDEVQKTEENDKGNEVEGFDELSKVDQEKINKIVKDRVSREKDKIAKAERALKESQDNFVKAQSDLSNVTSERDEAKTQISNLEKELEIAKNKSMKLEIALSEGVPLDVINAVRGDTEDEIRSSLESLKAINNFSRSKEIFESKSYDSDSDSYSKTLEALKKIR